MSDFSLRVVRADDLLILEFEFFNLRLDTSAPGVPQLVRVSPTDEARIVVHFQPQHLSEETFDENFGPPATSEGIRSFMTGTTRLAFTVPAAIATIPLTIESLLGWQVLAPVGPARPDPPANRRPTRPRSRCRIASSLSPTDAGQWSHRPARARAVPTHVDSRRGVLAGGACRLRTTHAVARRVRCSPRTRGSWMSRSAVSTHRSHGSAVPGGTGTRVRVAVQERIPGALDDAGWTVNRDAVVTEGSGELWTGTVQIPDRPAGTLRLLIEELEAHAMFQQELGDPEFIERVVFAEAVPL